MFTTCVCIGSWFWQTLFCFLDRPTKQLLERVKTKLPEQLIVSHTFTPVALGCFTLNLGVIMSETTGSQALSPRSMLEVNCSSFLITSLFQQLYLYYSFTCCWLISREVHVREKNQETWSLRSNSGPVSTLYSIQGWITWGESLGGETWW